jgi:hypothetical protein
MLDFRLCPKPEFTPLLMTYKSALLIVLSVGLFPAACSRSKSVARAPVTGVPYPDYAGPAPEIENQATSTPINLDTLPEPNVTAAETQPNLPPPAQHIQLPKPPKAAAVEPKREPRPSMTAPVENRPVAQAPPIQLLPQFSQRDKQALNRKINDQLDSARSILKTLDESQLREEQKPSLAAVHEFIRKSEEAVRRGEFYQGLVLAQKANTLAASLARTP